MTSSPSSGRLQIAFTQPLPSSTPLSQNDLFAKSQKILKLPTLKFTATYPLLVFAFRPEMTSPSISDRQQFAKTCSFYVMFGSRFVDNGAIDFKEVHRFGGKGNSSASFSLFNHVDVFAP